MKNIFFLLLFLFSSLVFAQGNSKDAPQLEYVCELKVWCDKPYTVGPTAHGERVVIPIAGGTFEGPKMKGKVMAGGADYQLVDKARGRTDLEAIYSIVTDDNIIIHVRNIGILSTAEEGTYFRTAPKFEAPYGSKYEWLNNRIFVCVPKGENGYISLKIWMVM
jgi:hypothetical protein